MPTDKIDQIYNAMVADGASMPDKQSFRKKMLASGAEGYKNRKDFYDAMSADGADLGGSYEAFSQKIGLHAVNPQPAQAKHAQSQHAVNPQPAQVKPKSPMTAEQKAAAMEFSQKLMTQTKNSNSKALQKIKNIEDYQRIQGFYGHTKKGKIEYNPKTGKMEQTYLTPQGYKITHKDTADMATHDFRVRQGFLSRMSDNGLDSDKPEDVVKQQQLDKEKPIRDVLDDVWREAEAQDRKAQEEYRNRAEKNAHSFSMSDMVGASSGAGSVFAGRGEDFGNDLEYQKKRHSAFDFDKMSRIMYDRLPEDYRAGMLKEYTSYFAKHPNETKGKSVAEAAKAALQGQIYNAVYNRAVKANAPKSRLEFLLRMISNQPLISSTVAAKTAAASLTGSHGLDIAERDAMAQFGSRHKALNVMGTVANMALDPVTYVSGGFGGIIGKKALGVAGKVMLGKSATDVAARYAAGTLAGRVAQGVVGGAANFATFNTLKGIEEQVATGGVVNPDTGKADGFSISEVLKSTGHGLLLGASIGTLSPLIGNFADKVVKATTSTAGKVALRAGETAVSTVAEGTVFSIPEWVSGDGDAFDVWTDSMALMLGFKASHAIKSAPRVIDALRTDGKRYGFSFKERLRKQMDAAPSDACFTSEELEELRNKGYVDLSMLFNNENKKKRTNPKNREVSTETVDDYENLTQDTFDGYEAMKRLMNDNSMSESTRAKAYYILTGRMLPMSTVTGYTTEIADDGSVVVNSMSELGSVVTSRRFTNEKAAQGEIDNIMRQSELNMVDVGEKYKETASNMLVVETAIKEVAHNTDIETVLQNYRKVKSGQEDMPKEIVEQAKAIDEAIERNRNIADINRPEAIRARFYEETGLDVDATLRKSPANRNAEEKSLVENYIKALFPEQERTEDGQSSDMQADAEYRQRIEERQQAYDEGREAFSVADAEGDRADADAIVLRLREAYEEIERVFGDDAEMRLAQLEDDPWEVMNDQSLTPDQQDAVAYFVNSKAAMDGLTEAANENGENRRAEAEHMVAQRTNKQSGMIHPATLKVDDRLVYIVSGNVTMFPDGSAVDIHHSSESVVVCDAETGELKFISLEQIYKVDEPVDPTMELKSVDESINAERQVILGNDVKAEKQQPQFTKEGIDNAFQEDVNRQTGVDVVAQGDEMQGALNQQSEYTKQMYEEEEQRKAEAEAQREAELENEHATALYRIPKGEDGEPLLEQTDPETAWDGVVEYMEDDSDAQEYVESMVKQLTKDVENAKKAVSKVKPSTDIVKFKADKSAARQVQADAEDRLAKWVQIANVNNSRKQAERNRINAERAESDRIAHDRSVAELAEQKRIESERKAEQEAVGTHSVNPKIKEKWDSSTKVVGNADVITLPDGSRLRGHYVLTEAGAATASHDVNNAYKPIDGFPIDENGQSVNDRDYERDEDARRISRSIADNYDSRALQSVTVVDNNGITLSGNGRNIAGELAAKNGTDGAYIEYLREFPQKYGLTAEQVNSMRHPRVHFVPDEILPYDAATFARFNAQEMKSQSKPEAAVKLGKIVPDNTFNSIVRSLAQYDRLSDFYANDRDANDAIMELVKAGVVNDKQLPELRTGEALSAAGRELLENTLIGKVFQANPDAVRQIIAQAGIKQSIVMALSEIAHNRTLAGGYDLSDELSKAVDLVARAKHADPDTYKEGMPVSPFGRQQGLFDDELGDSRVTDATTLLLSDILNSTKSGDLRKVLATYNSDAESAASGQLDIFSGDIRSKKEILTDINQHFINATPKEQQALVDAAIEERKRRAAEAAASEQSGRDSETEQTAPAETGSGQPQPIEGTPIGATSTPDEIQAQREQTETNPTEAQKEAGNYRKGHIKVDGFDIAIENPKGSTRSGKDDDGKEWSITMNHDYGYIRGTKGTDGDHIDVYLSDNPTAGNVYVVDQINQQTGAFDEHKVMYGFDSKEEAIQAYRDQYEDGWKVGDVTEVSRKEFKKWVDSSTRKTKPFVGYKNIKSEENNSIKDLSVKEKNVSLQSKSSENENSGRNTQGTGRSRPEKLGGNDAIGLQLERAGRESEKTDGGSLDERIEGERATAEKLAAEKGALMELDDLFSLGDIGPSGTESDTYFSPDGYVYKMNNLMHNPLISDYLKRLALHNKIFDNTPYELVGFVRSGRSLYPVVRQKTVNFERQATEEEITSYMQSLGFTADGDGKFHDSEHVVKDVKPKNVFMGKDKRVYVVDAEISKQENFVPSIKGEDESLLDYAARVSKESKVHKENSLSKSSSGYTITPTEYTNKKGKTSDMHLVKFTHELNKEEKAAAKTFINEPLSEGRRTPRGWYDREQGGYMMRSEETARQLVDIISDETAVADEQPLTAQDYRNAVKPDYRKTQEKQPANIVAVENVAIQYVETRKDITAQKGEGELEFNGDVSKEDFNDALKDLRNLLGVADDDGDTGILFRDDEELTKEQRKKIKAAGLSVTQVLVDNGMVNFSNYSGKMISLIGDKIRPWLKSFYEGIRWEPGYEQVDFTPSDEVARFDVQNFDKPTPNILKEAEMVVAEQKAAKISKQTEDEVKVERNEKRKEYEKQTEANTTAIAEEAEVVASETQTVAETAADERTVREASDKVDATLEKVNKQLALLGYYEADEIEKDFNEAYGYMRNAEKKAVKDAAELARQLAEDLGIDIYEATHTAPDKNVKRKTKPLATANIVPTGGDITISLPLDSDKGNLNLWISLDPVGDDLHVNGIMYRLNDGGNNFAARDVTYGKLLDSIKRLVGKTAKAVPTNGQSKDTGLAPAESSKEENQAKKNAIKKKSVSLKQEQIVGDLFGDLFSNDNSSNEKNERNDRSGKSHRGTESGQGELSAPNHVGARASVQDATRDSQGERLRPNNGSGGSGARPRYDVDNKYSNEEISDIVSSVADIKDGKVVITGDVTDDIRSIAKQYVSGGIAKEGRGVLDEYYTDGKIVDAVTSLITPLLPKGEHVRVLEPSVGMGNFLSAVPKAFVSKVTTFEINETTARIAKILHPDIEVNVRSFETEFIDDEGNKKPVRQTYDIAIGNPPYGAHRGVYKGLGEESKIARYEDYFVKRSLDVLHNGGVLAMVLPSSWLDRQKQTKGYELVRAYRLPSGAFAGTKVGTDIVVLRKSNDATATDVSNYFDVHRERILGVEKERTGRFGRLEKYIDGDIDAALVAIERDNAIEVASTLRLPQDADTLNDVQNAIEEAESVDGGKALVQAEQKERQLTQVRTPKKPETKADVHSIKRTLKKGGEVVSASVHFGNKFSDSEIEAFKSTKYDGTIDDWEKHFGHANYYNGSYVNDFYYAEGDIYARLEQLERDKNYIVKTHGQMQYDKQRKMLEDVLPKPKSIDDMTLTPNTSFVHHLMLGEKSLSDVFLDFTHDLSYDAFGGSSNWEVRGYVNNEQVYSRDKNHNQLVRDRRKKVGDALFKRFLKEVLDEHTRSIVVNAFNREYNGTYRPDYSKVPMFSQIRKDFKGKPLKLTSVQLAGVGRSTVKGVGVLAHEVGFGKTLSGVMAMHEAMTRGNTKKPLIVVPNDNIMQQWIDTIEEAIPEVTVNVLGNLGAKYDLTGFSVNDGEFSIVTYEGLKAMSFHDDTYTELSGKFSYITDELKEHKSLRDAEKAKAKNDELKGKIKKGAKKEYNFEDFGFDYLTFDEIHNANHIVGKVKLDKSEYSDFRSQSQRTSDIGIKTWIAAQYIQANNNGRNVLLLSATPFTNKPLEYYSILSLVANDTLKRKGFYNIDEFFKTFMEADNELEINASGKPVRKTNVRRFRNNGLFQSLLSEYIDIKGEEDNPYLVRPDRYNKEYKLPQNDLTQEAMSSVQDMLSDNETMLQGIGYARQVAFTPYAVLGMTSDHKAFVENSPKIDATIKLIEQNKKDRPDAGQIIYSEVCVDTFPMIREYLIKESGYKENEVRIITGATSNGERVKIQEAFNVGDVKVIIGSPAIKEGLNLQGNTTDMYILSLPWNFTQLRQIEGRGWRQGNRWKNIRINYMLTDDSVDVFMLQRLQTKQGLYNAAMKNGAETIDVSDIDTSELKAALIKDPGTRANITMLEEQTKLSDDLARLKSDVAFATRKSKAYVDLMDKSKRNKSMLAYYEKENKDSYMYKYYVNEIAETEKKLEAERKHLLEQGIDMESIKEKLSGIDILINEIEDKMSNDRKEARVKELTEQYAKERAEHEQKRGHSLDDYIAERVNENAAGYYNIRPKDRDARFRDSDMELETLTEDNADTTPQAKAMKVKALSVSLNTPIRVLSEPAEIAALSSYRKQRAKGWWSSQNDEVVVLLPNNADVADVENTVVHEIVGHKGLRKLIGEDRFDEFIGEVYNHASKPIRTAIDKAERKLFDAEVDRLTQRKNAETDRPNSRKGVFSRAEATVEANRKREQFRKEATEEYMADMAGRIGNHGFEKMSTEELTFWGKVKAKVQSFLNRFLQGLKIAKSVRLTDKDVAYILYKSWKNLRNGGKPIVMEEAEDALMRSKTHYNETDISRFRDGDMGLNETITSMKAEVSAANKDDFKAKVEAMKAIGGNLQKLRSAMALQRSYDISTAKAMTDLAQVLLDKGLLDNLSVYETKRVLSAVRNGVGKEDISGHVQKLMDIMVDNQLHNVANMLGKLFSIRGTRINDRGIEVQGNLDPAGQTLVKVARKYTSFPKEEIDATLIPDLMSRMGSDDQTIADNAATEYAGVQIARRYVEEITESKAEERSLRESIKTAKEDKEAGKLDAEAYKQYVKATEEAIRQNKIDRAEAYSSIAGELGGMLGESSERSKIWRKAEQERINEIHHNSNSDMEDRPTDEHHKDTKTQKLMNNSAVRFFLAPLGTFDQMLRMFGKKNVDGEGYLWNRFMRGWVDATENEYTGYRDALKELDAKVSEVYGKKMKWADLFALERKMDKFPVEFWDGGERKMHELTQGNMLYIYMANKMADGQMKLRYMGITEENVVHITEVLDPHFKELADWIQDEFLVEKRNKYNEVHKRMFGAPMTAIDNYFPLKILHNAIDRNEDVAEDDNAGIVLPGTTTSGIIKRTRNNKPLDVTCTDAFSIVCDHVQEMEHWAAFAELTRDINTMLSYKRFRNQVMNMTSAYGAGSVLWKNFRNACKMSVGAYRPPIAELDKAAVNIAKGVTAAKVSFRIFTALKQFLSMPAYLPDSNPVFLMRNIANPVNAWRWSMENLPIFNKRWNSRIAGDPRLMKSEMDWKMWRSRVVEIASRIGMSPNAFVDALTVSIGSHAMYQTRYAKYKKWGFDDTTADKKAKQDATILYNLTQQSSDGAFLSTMQVDRSWLSTLFTVFRNSSMSYTRQEYDALRNEVKLFTPGYRKRSQEFMAKQLRRQGLTEEQAEKAARSELRKGPLRNLARVIVFGFVMQAAWNLGAYLPYLLIGENDEEKDKMLNDAMTHALVGSFEGLTGGDAISNAGNMMLQGEGNWLYIIKDMPIMSDLTSILKKWPRDNVEALNDCVNLLTQSAVGVNPQSITDALVAIIDACGDDAQTARECALLIARIINCPPSQIDKIYFDELGVNGIEASKMTPRQIAERYARYKRRRQTPLTGWMYGEEGKQAVEGKYKGNAIKKAKESLNTVTDGRDRERMEQWREERKETLAKVKAINKLKTENEDAADDALDALESTPEYERYEIMNDYKNDISDLTKEWLQAETPADRELAVKAMLKLKQKMVEELKAVK